MEITSKDRVNIALSWHEPPDRPPIQTYLTPEIEVKLQRHFGHHNLLDVLGVDFRSVGGVWKGPLKPSTPEGVFYDVWGIGYRNAVYEFGTYPEACDLSLARITTMGEFCTYPWPDIDDFDFSTIEAQCDEFKDFAVCVGDAGTPDIVNGVSRGRGMEQVLVDIACEDEVGMAIIDRRVDFYYQYVERALQASRGKIDIVCLGEDCGTQKGRLVSPAVFERVFRPRLERFYDLAHRYGAKAMMHCCGDTSDLQATFIDMGLDVLDAMQPEPPGMRDIEALRSRTRGKLAYCGLISTQQTLPHGTVAQCRTEARHRLDVIAKGGGYIFAPAHCIQPDTPLDNILAVYEEVLGKRPI
jgi:uroporphyrinogen decarboxylase